MEEIRQKLDKLETHMDQMSHHVVRMDTLMTQEFIGSENRPGRIYEHFKVQGDKLTKIENVLDGDLENPGVIGKVQTLWRMKNWLIGIVTALLSTALVWYLGIH